MGNERLGEKKGTVRETKSDDAVNGLDDERRAMMECEKQRAIKLQPTVPFCIFS